MRCLILFMTATLSLGLSACAVPVDGDEDLGVAAQAQIDPGQRDYVVYTISQNSIQLGTVLVAHTTGGGYYAGLEYWYMTGNVSMGSSLTISGAAAQYWSSPPSSLGTLSFVMQQEPAWTATTPRGSLLQVVNPINGDGVMMNWHMSAAGGIWSGYIVWYHNSTSDVFGPGTSNTLSPTTSYTGSYYYYVANPL